MGDIGEGPGGRTVWHWDRSTAGSIATGTGRTTSLHLNRVEPLGDLGVAAHELPKADEGPHDEDAHLDSLRAAQNLRGMMAPCSAKAQGNFLRPPWAELEVTDCDFSRGVCLAV